VSLQQLTTCRHLHYGASVRAAHEDGPTVSSATHALRFPYVAVRHRSGGAVVEVVKMHTVCKSINEHDSLLMLHKRAPTSPYIVRLVRQTPVMDVPLLARDGDRADWSTVVDSAHQEGVFVHGADGVAGEACGDGFYQGDAAVSGHLQQADLFAEEGVNLFC